MDKQSELRLALNGKMCLLAAGVMLIFVAVTSTMTFGVNLFLIAHEASKGTKDAVDLLAQVNMGIGLARFMGVCLILTAAVEIFTGISGVRFSNRVDRAPIMQKIIVSLLIIEVLMNIFLFVTKALSIGMLFTAFALPLFMLWGVSKFKKLLKEDPDRVYAVKTEKEKARQRQQAAASSGKSLRERAMMQAAVPDDPADDESVEEFGENAEEVTEMAAEPEAVTEQSTEPEAEDAPEKEAE